MVYRKNVIAQFKTKFSMRKIDFSLYEEMSTLFEIYVTCKYSLKDERMLKLSSVHLIKDIGYMLHEQIDTEGLLRVYPLTIKTHLLYYLVNDLHMDNFYLNLLKEVYHKQFIQNNEWLASEWKDIQDLYDICCMQANASVVNDKITEIYRVIQQLEQRAIVFSALQSLWFALFLEELHEQRYIN